MNLMPYLASFLLKTGFADMQTTAEWTKGNFHRNPAEAPSLQAGWG
jgi:hypothetical protein